MEYQIKFINPDGKETSFTYEESSPDILRASKKRDVEIEKENALLLESEEKNPKLQEKLNLPYSCSSGVCGSCLGKLVEGELDQYKTSCLDPLRHKEGYYLLCSSRPKSDCVIETYKKDDLYVQ